MRHRVWLVLAAVGLGTACVPRQAESTRLQVVASFYPLYEFASRIGGERAVVRNLVPAGTESHDYEPTPHDVLALQQADIIVYHGAGFDPWIERITPSKEVVVEATRGLPLQKVSGTLDPHVWLDPVLAEQMVQRIVEGFVKADPAAGDVYRKRAASLTRELHALHTRFDQGLRDCPQRILITSHAAFGYLARRYRLQVVPITGLAPEADPTPAKVREIVKLARRHNVRAVFFESLVSPRVAQTIAREVGARARVLNPIEGLTPDELRAGMNYVTVMDDNLRNLASGLGCR